MSNALNLGDIQLPGDNYLSLFGFNIPVTSGLEGAYLFGDGVSQAPKNYAPGKANAAVVGSLVAGANFITMSEAGYIDTGIAETADMTILSVFRDSTGTSDAQPGFVGNHSTLALGGVALIYSSAGANISGQAIKAQASDFASTPWSMASFTMVAYRPRGSAVSQISNLTTGSSGQSSSTAARTLSAQPIWIGRIPSNSFKGLSDQVACLIFSRALSDSEINTLAVWLRAYCASKAINV